MQKSQATFTEKVAKFTANSRSHCVQKTWHWHALIRSVSIHWLEN